MGRGRRRGDRRMYAAATWSVPVLVVALPAAALLAISQWGLAGAGLMVVVVVVAALVGARRPPGVAAGVASGLVVAVGTCLAGLVLVVAAGVVVT